MYKHLYNGKHLGKHCVYMKVYAYGMRESFSVLNRRTLLYNKCNLHFIVLQPR